jgi:hypothetical protein
MTRKKELEQGLRHLLKHRRVLVDEERLEAIRAGLLRRSPRSATGAAGGFFPRHRFSLSFGTALVLAGLIWWQVLPQREGRMPGPAASRLMEIAQNEGQMDQALALLGGFASASSQGETLIEWEVSDRSLLGHYRDENLLETLYGSI